MKITVQRYSFLLSFQFAFLIADLFFNSFAQFWLGRNSETICIFFLQDIFIVCEYVFFTYIVHSTCVYEVGASHIILQKCKLFLFVTLLYLLLSVAQHFWIVYNMFYAKPNATASLTLTILSFLQHMVSSVYYYSIKRTALVITDPRYDESNIDWIAERMGDM